MTKGKVPSIDLKKRKAQKAVQKMAINRVIATHLKESVDKQQITYDYLHYMIVTQMPFTVWHGRQMDFLDHLVCMN